MKLTLLICWLTISLAACNAPDQKSEAVTLNSNEVVSGPVVHDSLTADQVAKIKAFHKVFEDVYPVSFEETITNFKRDQNPDKEIAVWMNMAAAYKTFNQKMPAADPMEKQEAFKLLLLRSMMPDQEAIKEAKPQVLSQEVIKDLLRDYNAK